MRWKILPSTALARPGFLFFLLSSLLLPSLLECVEYENKCYCIGVEPKVRYDPKMHEAMINLARDETDQFAVHTFPVYPAAGVPSLPVLQWLLPGESLSYLQDMTYTQYGQHVNQFQIDYAARQTNLGGAGKRRKRRSLTRRRARRMKRSIQAPAATYRSALLPENKVYGIKPLLGDVLDGASSCVCSSAPSSKARKEVRKHVEWSEAMADLSSAEFRALKKEVEMELDALCRNDTSLTQDEYYAGVTVVSVALITEDDPAATHVTKNDLIQLEAEFIFDNPATSNPAPKNKLDTILSTAQAAGLTSLKGDYTATDSDCKMSSLASIGVPAYLQLVSPSSGSPGYLESGSGGEDLLLDGFTVSYECVPSPGVIPMIPKTSDVDGNFLFEVSCVNGNFQWPTWPTSCPAEQACTAVPDPPAGNGLVRKDTRAKFRADDYAYFGCADQDAIVSGTSGMNVHAIQCESTGAFNTGTWPTCTKESVCSSLPAPPAGSGMVKQTAGDSVRLGEYVVYECEQRDLFYETPDGPELKSLCNNPVTGDEGTLDPITTWPTCTQLECKCLGDPAKLDLTQSLAVLNGACTSVDAFEAFAAVDGKGYAVPKRTNCGSYKPDAPTVESKCSCDADLGEPFLVWNDMELLSVTWNEDLANAFTDTFKATKALAEAKLDAYYLANAQLAAAGYIRSLVLRFESGTSIPGGGGTKYTKVLVEHQFRADTTMTVSSMSSQHIAMMNTNSGELHPDFHISPITSVGAVRSCDNGTLATVFRDAYAVEGAEGAVSVGQSVAVSCAKPIQFLKEDRWDQDPTDNKLTITCMPNESFDVPYTNDLPDCKAKCSVAKPAAPDSHNITFDNSGGLKDVHIWQDNVVQYKCLNDIDGIAQPGEEAGTFEGSNDKTVAVVCNDDGQYELQLTGVVLDNAGAAAAAPTAAPAPASSGNDTGNATAATAAPTPAPAATNDGAVTDKLPKCLPRPKRCKCLGSFTSPAQSLAALDDYCRASFAADYAVMKSGRERDPVTHDYVDLVVPEKSRCGSLDELEIKSENECKCESKDGEGAKDGVIVHLEMVNLPYRATLSDPTSEDFKTAKLIVEKALDTMYINDASVIADGKTLYRNGYVRSVVLRMWKGETDLEAMRDSFLANSTGNETDIRQLTFPGEPIMGEFSKTEADYDDIDSTFAAAVAAAVASGATPPVKDKIMSTVVQIEVQLLEANVIPPAVLLEHTRQLIAAADDWVNDDLWVLKACFTGTVPVCQATDIGSCRNADLGVVSSLRLTHSQTKATVDAPEPAPVPVGGYANLFCLYPNERITFDTLDDDPLDHQISVLCRPDESFDFPPNDDFPKCSGWCPLEKPMPPPETGLVFVEKPDSDREYIVNEKLTYACTDTSLGIDASDATSIDYACVQDVVKGRYAVPRTELGEAWPVCSKRTTTINPPILKAIDQSLSISDSVLIERKTQEHYLSEKYAGDEDFHVTILTPAIILLLLVLLICLCCSRIDNPLCKYCSENYAAMK